jgi:hypothetical protein
MARYNEALATLPLDGTECNCPSFRDPRCVPGPSGGVCMP